MAENLQSNDHADEDFIHMEVSSPTNLHTHSVSSPSHAREFEFQMFSSSSERETINSPADELFYKGKLLPLHLPPRLEMFEELLGNSSSYENKIHIFKESFSTPLTMTTNTTPTATTPYESCNISPAESCQISRELNPEEYFFEYSTESSTSIGECSKGTWIRKFKMIKHSSLSSKLKASRAYLKSFFSKSGCSVDSCAASSINVEGSVLRVKECVNKYGNATKNTPFGQIHKDGYQIPNSVTRNCNKKGNAQNGGGHHRRSFSGAIKRISMTMSSSLLPSSGSSSSSSSNNSNGSHKMQYLKRSGSANSDIENSIQAAIAHCKKSQQQCHSRKTGNDIVFCTLSASRLAYEDQERPELCRG